MKVSGFTFIRNAVKYDYPVKEAINSILPLCDEVVVAMGNSEDDTRSLIQSIGSTKIRMIDTIWDDSLREGGRVLAVETDKAFRAISPESTWAFYIQGDEVLPEKYLVRVHEAMIRYEHDLNVEGLLFRYRHFYGSYDFTGVARRWYRREIRIVRNNPSICSYKDAQGFRKDGRKLRVKEIDAEIYHYGWVKPPSLQQAKQEYFHKLWHDDSWMEKNILKQAEFDYSQIDALERFTEEHPDVMKERIAAKNWKFDFDPTRNRFSLKQRLLLYIERLTGWRPGEYKNYKKI